MRNVVEGVLRRSSNSVARMPARGRVGQAVVVMLGLLGAPAVFAASFEFEDPDLSLNWDTTVKYSAAGRVAKRSATLVGADGSVSSANQDDGDRNFKRGVISNRFDIYSEADLKYRSFGGRVSAAGWYDTVYNKSNYNNSPGTSNNVSVPANEFTKETRDVMGRKAELLDAFVFGKADLGAVPVNARLGRHALQWGESLFFGNNAVASAMAPLDVVKAAQIPNSLTREIVRPVGQLSGTAELTPNLSAAAYYQYDWEKSRLPPVGSYFSPGDILDVGGECLRTTPGPACNAPRAGLLRREDLKAKDSGQFGLRLKYSDKERGVDYGVYALRFHSKTGVPNLKTGLVTPGPPFPVPVAYQIVYPENIRLFGVSAALVAGPFQVNAEASKRSNAPLVGSPPPTGAGFDNDKNPAYAVGNTAHAQVSFLTTLPESGFSDGGAVLGELAWNRVLSVTRNPNAVSSTGTRDAYAFRVVFAPAYNQVLDGLDITVPVGLGYSPRGKSLAVSQFAVDKGGDLTLGVSGTYLTVWQFSATYRRFFGSEAPNQDAANQFTYKQVLGDRDFVSVSLSRAF